MAAYTFSTAANSLRSDHTISVVTSRCIEDLEVQVCHHSVLSRVKGIGSPYSIMERRVPELIPVLGSQPAGDVSHKPGGRLILLSAKPAVTSATLKRAATNFAAW